MLISIFLFQFLNAPMLNSNSLIGLGEALPPLESQGLEGLLKGAYSTNNLQLLFNYSLETFLSLLRVHQL